MNKTTMQLQFFLVWFYCFNIFLGSWIFLCFKFFIRPKKGVLLF